jgi:hypothetical protein
VISCKPCPAGGGDGRSGEIRTPDPLVPNQMRYQTALHSEPGRTGDAGEIHASPLRCNSKNSTFNTVCDGGLKRCFIRAEKRTPPDANCAPPPAFAHCPKKIAKAPAPRRDANLSERVAGDNPGEDGIEVNHGSETRKATAIGKGQVE